MTDFQNSFTLILSRRFAIKTSIQIPPHLNGVAPLPCEILVYKIASTELKAQQRQTRRAHSEENVTAIGELALSQ